MMHFQVLHTKYKQNQTRKVDWVWLTRCTVVVKKKKNQCMMRKLEVVRFHWQTHRKKSNFATLSKGEAAPGKARYAN